MFEKPRHVTLIKVLWFNLLQLTSAHYHIKGTRNVRYKNLDDAKDNLGFVLEVWLFGGWAESSLNPFEQKLLKKITLHKNWNCSVPKTGILVNKFAYKIAVFFSITKKRISSLARHNWLKYSPYTTLYLLDLFGFLNKFVLYHYAILPSYRRVKWGWLSGSSHVVDPMQQNIPG